MSASRMGRVLRIETLLLASAREGDQSIVLAAANGGSMHGSGVHVCETVQRPSGSDIMPGSLPATSVVLCAYVCDQVAG